MADSKGLPAPAGDKAQPSAIIPPSAPAYKSKIDRCKRKHRPGLKLPRWNKDGYAETDVCEKLGAAVLDGDDATRPPAGEPPENAAIPRVDCRALSVPQFVERFERPGRPVVITHIPTHEGWAASTRELWDVPQLRAQYRRRRFKCGEDDDGYAVKIKLAHFLKYMHAQDDDSPLYIFDSHFDGDAVSKELLNQFYPPSYFRDDLFRLVGESKRPPYRWFLVGPKRSGTCVHTDPLHTSAWNTVVSGRKLWVLFPPSTSKRLVKGKHHIRKGGDDEPVHYFNEILPHVKEECRAKGVPVYEFVQLPGDTLFVPSGWWHAVLNLEDSIAVTQNFASHSNFDQVWCDTRGGRKKMAVRFLRELDVHYPHLAARARELNAKDGFEMYTKARAEAKKKAKAEAKARKDAARRGQRILEQSERVCERQQQRPSPPSPPPQHDKQKQKQQRSPQKSHSKAAEDGLACAIDEHKHDDESKGKSKNRSKADAGAKKRKDKDRGKRKGLGGGGHYKRRKDSEASECGHAAGSTALPTAVDL